MHPAEIFRNTCRDIRMVLAATEKVHDAEVRQPVGILESHCHRVIGVAVFLARKKKYKPTKTRAIAPTMAKKRTLDIVKHYFSNCSSNSFLAFSISISCSGLVVTI